jgi:predicted dehydrogenase
MTIRTAVIGAGLMGRSHIESLAKVPRVEVVAVADPHEPGLQAAVADFRVPAGYADARTMLEKERPDYVVVPSPALYHAEHSIAAFEAGAHVLCEKPLCMSTAEAEAIIAAAKRTGRLFTMGLQFRQLRTFQALKEFIGAGKLGQVYHTRVWAGHIMAYPWGRFFHRREYSLGGVVASTTVHLLDLAMWIIGAPEPLTVSASTFRRIDKMPNPPVHFEGEVGEVTVEDFGHAHVRFVDGSSMSVEGNWLTHPRSRPGGFEINGVLGVVTSAENTFEIELEDHDKIVPFDLDVEHDPTTHGDRTVTQHEVFVDAIQGNGEPIVRFREALAVQRIVSGFYQSAEKGAEVGV